MLRPSIEIQFNAPVWRMEIDEDFDTICVEVRNAKDKTVSFSSVDLNTSKQYFTNLTLPMGWQCALAAATNGVMLVNGYQSTILPVSKGLSAIDIKSSEMLWADYNLNLERKHPLGLEVYDVRIQPKRVMLVSNRTGGVIIPRLEIGKTEPSYIKHPQQVNKGVLNDLADLPSIDNESMLFLEYNDYRILSLHALSASLLTQHLFVYDIGGNLIFEDIIARHIQKLQPEAFILYKNKLIWLQNRSILKVLNL